jgi:predicted phosphate transport protein (TIGR00153 family)
MFLRKLIPQDKVYFELFRELGESVREAGEALTRLAEDDCLVAATAEELKKIEHHADDLTHELLRRMESTFVTPFDREDIHMLADRLDEVVDTTEEVARLAAVFQIERLNGPTAEMARILGRACAQVADAVAALPATAPVLEATKEVRTTETYGDALYYTALGELFENSKDPLEVIKWKDIIEHLEIAIDACEDVAGTLEGIALKHG